jgi:hypothetical protein
MDQFTRVEFERFKAFQRFTIDLKHVNILVGPNNSGKSTIIAAFRILAAGLRVASTKRPTLIRYKGENVPGYPIDLSSISVAEENIYWNYDDDEVATIKFTLSSQRVLTLYFPEQGVCHLIPEAESPITTVSSFKSAFKCKVGFVPILGPVEHNEPLYQQEAARLALYNYRAARNFRNIWHHFPEKFDEFRETLRVTWPGMDVLPPEIDVSHSKPLLRMYCPEERIPRELFWAGFGFQVWCQMLTHLVQSRNVSLFLIDEPDIYLHSELQRQLIGLLRNLGPDILLATHSTEIIVEAESDEIVLVRKDRRTGKRIKDTSQLANVFASVGSNINPILTQLAKTRRAVFVEGKDFQIVGRFARKMGQLGVGNRRDFAVIPIEGFNPERAKNLIAGMEATLGSKILAAIILDRDYRGKQERAALLEACSKFTAKAYIHERKEIENFLLIPSAIDRAVEGRLADRKRRTGEAKDFVPCAREILDAYCAQAKISIMARLQSEQLRWEKEQGGHRSTTTINEEVMNDVELLWANEHQRLAIVPGKDALGALNGELQDRYGVSITPSSIIESIRVDEMPSDMIELIDGLVDLSRLKSPELA